MSTEYRVSYPLDVTTGLDGGGPSLLRITRMNTSIEYKSNKLTYDQLKDYANGSFNNFELKPVSPECSIQWCINCLFKHSGKTVLSMSTN